MAKRAQRDRRSSSAVAPRSPEPSRGLVRWAVLLGGVAAALHLGSLRGEFISDDEVFVEGNALLLDDASWLDPWRQPFPSARAAQGALYRPLTVASYRLDRQLFGPGSTGFHATNLVLHGEVTALVILAGGALGAPRVAAILTGALFACHPVHVEAVSWVSGRAELLAALGCLLSLLAWARYRQRARALWLIAAALSYVLALTAKETAVPLPLALVLLDVCGVFGTSGADVSGLASPVASSWRRRWLPYAGFAFAFALYFALRWLAVGRLTPAPELLVFAGASPATRYLTGLAVIGRAIALLLLPYPQRFDYSAFTFATGREPEVWWGALTLGLVLLGILRWRRRRPLEAGGLCWFVSFLLPVSHLILPLGTVFAERFVYVPSVGACGLAGLLLARLLAQRRAWRVPIAMLVLALATASLWRSLDWRSSEQLWESELRHTPTSIKARLMIIRQGQSRFRRTGDPGALRRGDELAAQVMQERRGARGVHTNETLEVAIAHADALLRQGDVEGALESCRQLDGLLQRNRALPARLRPLLAFHCGKTHEARGEHVAAAERYREALAVWPQWDEVRRRLEAVETPR